MAISIAEARRRGWLKDELKPTKAKKPKEVTHWTRDNLKDWYGPNGWHVGIARQLREGAMIDLVVAWQGSIPKIHEMAVWAEFKRYTRWPCGQSSRDTRDGRVGRVQGVEH